MPGIYDMPSIYIFAHYFEEEMGERNLHIRNTNHEPTPCSALYVQHFSSFFKTYLILHIIIKLKEVS